MNQRKHPFAINPQGNPTAPQDGESGIIYSCWNCESAKLISVDLKEHGKHFRTMFGTKHDGPICSRSEKNENLRIKTIDIASILSNARKTASNDKPAKKPDIEKKPRKPRSESEEVVALSSLRRLIALGINQMEDYSIEDGRMLTDHYVSLLNADLLLSNNNSIGKRALEVYFDHVFIYRKTIRFMIEKETCTNGYPVVRKKLIDFKFDRDDEFEEAVSMYFIRIPGEERKYIPKYRKAHVAGNFHAIEEAHCRDNRECTNKCVIGCIECSGRQFTQCFSAKGQIAVDERDRIPYFGNKMMN